MRHLVIILIIILLWCLFYPQNTREAFTESIISNIKQTHRRHRRNIRKKVDQSYKDALAKIKRTMRKSKLV